MSFQFGDSNRNADDMEPSQSNFSFETSQTMPEPPPGWIAPKKFSELLTKAQNPEPQPPACSPVFGNLPVPNEPPSEQLVQLRSALAMSIALGKQAQLAGNNSQLTLASKPGSQHPQVPTTHYFLVTYRETFKTMPITAESVRDNLFALPFGQSAVRKSDFLRTIGEQPVQLLVGESKESISAPYFVASIFAKRTTLRSITNTGDIQIHIPSEKPDAVRLLLMFLITGLPESSKDLDFDLDSGWVPLDQKVRTIADGILLAHRIGSAWPLFKVFRNACRALLWRLVLEAADEFGEKITNHFTIQQAYSTLITSRERYILVHLACCLWPDGISPHSKYRFDASITHEIRKWSELLQGLPTQSRGMHPATRLLLGLIDRELKKADLPASWTANTGPASNLKLDTGIWLSHMEQWLRI